MSENIIPTSRAECDSDEFRGLGLAPGNWVALAPLPLFRSDFNFPHSDDLTALHKLQQPLRVEAFRQNFAEWAPEAEAFWKKLCTRVIPPEHQEAAHALLAWHLAVRLARTQRESYLYVLDAVAARFVKSMRPLLPAAQPSYLLRQRLERYLPHAVYSRYPAELRIAPPSPYRVAEIFGSDLWKQMLIAPIAGALGEAGIRAASAASVAEVLAHVTLPHPYNKAYPLETYLAAGSWRRLFEGLLHPERREETDPAIRSGMDIAAHGLASLPFAEREMLLQTIREQIERGIDRHDRKATTADEWIGLLRMKVEEVMRQSPPVALGPTEPLSPPLLRQSPMAHANMSNPKSNAHPAEPAQNENSALGKPAADAPAVTAAVAVNPNPTASKNFAQVERAEPFVMVGWEVAIAVAKSANFARICAWLEDPQRPGLLFDDRRTECTEVAIVRDAAAVPSALWIVGDLHADVLSLANIIAHAKGVAELEGTGPPSFVFLGDFVDRGRFAHETLLLLFQLILEDPSRVCVLPGNHDIDLQWDEKAEKFRVTIEPAEYCERLNGILQANRSDSNDEVTFARLLVAFWKSRPKAAILPDGTLLAHGGFPHADMQGLLKTPADLARQNCLNDFLWARLAESARKRPNRGNRGHEFGWETLAQFCKLSAQIGIPPIERFVRGHDHVPRRWQTYPDYAEYPVLTINAMGRRMEGEPAPGDSPHPFPVVARYVPNRLPTVVRLPLDPHEVDRAFAKNAGDAAAANTSAEARASASASLLSALEEVVEISGVRLDPLHNLLPKPDSDSQANGGR